jgi:predicted nucleic acid-binding protein
MKIRNTVEKVTNSSKAALERVSSKEPDAYELAIIEYNTAYNDLNDAGIGLLLLRQRCIDTIEFVEELINSITNTPKSFETDIASITITKNEFRNAQDFATQELKAARKSATTASAGIAAGAAVASMAPSAAMWIATTFGTASTGTAISTLSGAAATNAALAWLGGGALVAEGGGMAAGSALLAMAGPIGWSVAGVTLLTSVVLFVRSKQKTSEEKYNELKSVITNTFVVVKLTDDIQKLTSQTNNLRIQLRHSFIDVAALFNGDFNSFSEEDQLKLGALVNETKSLSCLINTHIVEEAE